MTVHQVLLSLLLISLCSAAIIPHVDKPESGCIILNNCRFPSLQPNPQPSPTPNNPVLSATSSQPSPSAQPSTSGNNFLIQRGYVAFGDSYAAGIGTGTTEGSGCRQGSYSYPKQLARFAAANADFQNLPCSGAVVGEVLQGGDRSQIDAWKNPGNAEIATLSIGGNDIGFYNILTACVLRVGKSFAGDCNEEVRKAQEKISGVDLFNDISSALHQIIDKSGREDFRVFVTGYPAFFNVDTGTCDYTTFYYWNPGHHDSHRTGTPYLYKALRLQLNDLVTNLNNLLRSVTDAVNKSNPKQKVWFVDPNPRFDGHRFCEKDGDVEVVEPDKSRSDTWLFLSAWPDNSLPDSDSAQDAGNEEMNAVIAGPGDATLPDASTCKNTLGQSTDWADRILCDTAIALAGSAPLDYQGPNNATNVFDDDKIALANGELEAADVPWYIPTRQAKTFHPRTLGQKAYVEAIRDVW